MVIFPNVYSFQKLVSMLDLDEKKETRKINKLGPIILFPACSG